MSLSSTMRPDLLFGSCALRSFKAIPSILTEEESCSIEWIIFMDIFDYIGQLYGGACVCESLCYSHDIA